jgi:hypothetical protein
MCVECSTDASDNELALNRANLISAFLIQRKVPRFLLTPIGRGGGGEKVRVYPR